jgi:hypothetical protein
MAVAKKKTGKARSARSKSSTKRKTPAKRKAAAK